MIGRLNGRAADVPGRVDAMTIDPGFRVQSLYVPVSDGVHLAIDVQLPVEGIARGEGAVNSAWPR